MTKNSPDIIFEMFDGRRKRIISSLEFFYTESTERLLSQFNSIDEEAEKFVKNENHRLSAYYNPDTDNADQLYELAWDNTCDFHESLCEMKKNIILSTMASMYHTWEKELRSWLSFNVAKSMDNTSLEVAIWECQNNGSLLGIFSKSAWKPTKENYYHEINKYRLIVNVYKHGNGPSLLRLKKKYPDYYDDSFEKSWGLSNTKAQEWAGLAYEKLKIQESDILCLKECITAFWQSVPQYINLNNAEISGFLETAYKKAEQGRMNTSVNLPIARKR